jgi:caffeoyl-CoA O-methyltransferase
MEFIDQNLSEYAEAHTTAESELLQKLNRQTYAEVLIPRMLSGHLQGRFLSMISRLKSPKYILEIGTYTGYSALCLAEGLQENGRLVTMDKNEELESMVLDYFSKSGFTDKIEFKCGNAMDMIPELEEGIDLVFIDADKENYLNYYKMVLPKMSKGGVVLADNVLWSGKVVNESDVQNDEETGALHAFNEFVQQDNRVTNVLVPIRDGILMAIKE